MSIKFMYTPSSETIIDRSYWSKLNENSADMEFLPYQNDAIRALDIILIDLDEALSSDHLFKSYMIIVLYENEIDLDDANELKKKYGQNLLGLIDVLEDATSYLSLFENATNCLSMKATDNDRVNIKLIEALYRESLSELERVKKIHGSFVPMRSEHFKNCSLYSKFAAGLSRGGEFFDLHKNNNEIVIILGSFQSYLGTSVMIKSFEEIKKIKKVSKDTLLSFLENFTDACREINIVDRDDYTTLQLDILHFDIRTLLMSGFHFGNANIFLNGSKEIDKNILSLNENNFDDAYFELHLSRGDRCSYFSPGSIQNFEIDKRSITELLNKYHDVSTRELVNECMFQLKEKGLEDFLKFDTSLIFLEVDDNAIVTV